MHYSHRAPWLRAAVLGANDGLVSVAALMLGVAAGGADAHIIFLSGLSALVAGALSMAVGEYVSVWSQRDAEQADLARERTEFLRTPHPHHSELDELTSIYISRGLPHHLARRIAEHFHTTSGSVEDLVKIHARDELGIDTEDLADPWQATISSLVSFAAGGVVPIVTAAIVCAAAAASSITPSPDPDHPSPTPALLLASITAIAALALLAFGALGARLGGAPAGVAALRVLLGGLVALGVTFGVGMVVGMTAG
ncbi:hypothetical protein HDU93_004301 [Gonapodya sp. JEL0774]|nr:hypothetical protein HDU93_004301 [Gonapodya sp. JEL0774]